jgi:hypothetical protein
MLIFTETVPPQRHQDAKVHKERPSWTFVSWCLSGETLLNALIHPMRSNWNDKDDVA